MCRCQVHLTFQARLNCGLAVPWHVCLQTRVSFVFVFVAGGVDDGVEHNGCWYCCSCCCCGLQMLPKIANAVPLENVLPYSEAWSGTETKRYPELCTLDELQDYERSWPG